MSCDFHDAAAALVVDGDIVAAVEEERLSRVKHDGSVPAGAIETCLRIAGLGAGDVDVVALYERPTTVLARFLAARQRQGPAGFASFVRDAPSLVSKNLMVAYRVDRVLHRLGATGSPEFRYLDHHRSHAAAAFYPSAFERAAVLTVDGIGEWATASIGRGVGNRIDMMEELRYPDSLGLVYSFITAYCGFRPNDDEFKVMGLAPYGTPRFRGALDEMVQLCDDGSPEVRPARFGWFAPRGIDSRWLRQAFEGPPRRGDVAVTQREADLAASVQALVEDSMLALAEHAMALTGERRLCMAGGVALNCVANGRILRETGLEELWVQPAAGDAGSALGAALAVWFEQLGNERRVDGTRDMMRGSLLGPSMAHDDVAAWLTASDVEFETFADSAELCAEVAERIDSGAVVGWFQGRMEFGPRALGNRSILADPRDPTTRQHVNSKIKGREGFRPFAPAVLAEHAEEWFDLSVPSPYMLVVADVATSHLTGPVDEPTDLGARAQIARSDIPACTHVDGSARVQTVDAETNPRFRELLAAFHHRTGCPILLNTSFNVAGEPIVASPDDALGTARRAGLDLVVIEDCMVDLGASSHPRADDSAPTSRSGGTT